MQRTLSESSIVRAVALEACERITRKTILILQGMDYCLLAGNDSALNSTWGEVCVQVQGEESLHWEDYERTMLDILKAEFEKLSAHEQDAVWLQTDEGENWSYEDEDERPSDPVSVDESIDFMFRKFILERREIGPTRESGDTFTNNFNLNIGLVASEFACARLNVLCGISFPMAPGRVLHPGTLARDSNSL